jgi:hypothetical protein
MRREKRGWTGDGGHAAETLIFNFDMSSAYRKWLDDIVHASNRKGAGALTAPSATITGGSRSIQVLTTVLSLSALGS